MITQILTHHSLSCPFCGRKLKQLRKVWETAGQDYEGMHGEIVVRKGEQYSTGCYIETCDCGAEYSYTIDFPPYWEQKEDCIYYEIPGYDPAAHKIGKQEAGEGMYIRKRIDGNLMKKLRKTILGITQEELAQKIGQSLSSIKYKETGRRTVTFEDAVKLKKIIADI